jgi:hypothetical protein
VAERQGHFSKAKAQLGVLLLVCSEQIRRETIEVLVVRSSVI